MGFFAYLQSLNKNRNTAMNFKYLTFLFLILLQGCRQETLETIKGDNYTISYSSDWKLDETVRNNVEFSLVQTPVTGEFRNNINLLIQDLHGTGIDLAEYTQISVEQLNENGKIIGSQKKIIGNIEFQELTFEAFMKGFDLKFLQYYFIKDEKAYVLTFTALKSDFDIVLPEAIKVLNSFKITQP